jgi:triacylglycerol esterase/lipase EstA (alpha/beta hydrolase family)
MRLLEYWLEEAGYHTVNYSYPSITRSPAENADDLQTLCLNMWIRRVIHFLGHSMGGLVVRLPLFHYYPEAAAWPTS